MSSRRRHGRANGARYVSRRVASELPARVKNQTPRIIALAASLVALEEQQDLSTAETCAARNAVERAALVRTPELVDQAERVIAKIRRKEFSESTVL